MFGRLAREAAHKMRGQGAVRPRPPRFSDRDCPGGSIRQLDVIFGRGLAGLVEGPGFDLANPLLGHAHFAADFLQRQRLAAVVEAEPADDDLPLALVEARQNPLDLLLADALGRFLRRAGRCGRPASP